MPTGEETGLADGMLSCSAWYAQHVGGTKESGGGYTAVYVECGTRYARFQIRKLDWAILYRFMDEV